MFSTAVKFDLTNVNDTHRLLASVIIARGVGLTRYCQNVTSYGLDSRPPNQL